MSSTPHTMYKVDYVRTSKMYLSFFFSNIISKNDTQIEILTMFYLGG